VEPKRRIRGFWNTPMEMCRRAELREGSVTNATMRKFGWPGSRVAELDHWAVMLRPQQCTLGAVILACKQPVTAFGEVDAAGPRNWGSP